MKSLWDNAEEEAKINLLENDFGNMHEVFCEGYCSGVWAALYTISKDPEYKEAYELIKWKLGIEKND